MMSTTNIVNHHSLFDEEQQDPEIPMQMGFNIPFPPNMTLPPLGNCHDQSLKGVSAIITPEAATFAEALLATAVQKPREFQDLASGFGCGGGQNLDLNRSRMNSW